MFQEIVRSSVPDDFVEIRPVGNLASGRNNVGLFIYTSIYMYIKYVLC